MKLIIGLIVVFGSVLGGYVLSKGNLLALWQPLELLIIGGAALGALIIANPFSVSLRALRGFIDVCRAPAYPRERYMELLSLLYALLTKARKDGLMSIEDDIEDPEQSELFQTYPGVLGDHHARDFLCDYMRIVVSGGVSPFELDNLMQLELETHHEEAHAPSHALSQIADALPGFGIIAAVLGIVITMSLIGGDPAVVGKKVAAALVGTLLGILLAYGFVGPVATALAKRAHDESKFLECIRVCILASVQGYSPQIAVEFGRKTMLSHLRPAFAELEQHVKGTPASD